MSRITILISTILVIATLGGGAIAAEQQVQWCRVFNVKLKPGKAMEADAFVKKYLTTVDEKIGRKVVTYVYQDGPWDRVSYFPAVMTKDGIETVPSDQVWWKAFVEQEGSEEKAAARMAQFMNMGQSSRQKSPSRSNSGRRTAGRLRRDSRPAVLTAVTVALHGAKFARTAIANAAGGFSIAA